MLKVPGAPVGEARGDSLGSRSTGVGERSGRRSGFGLGLGSRASGDDDGRGDADAAGEGDVLARGDALATGEQGKSCCN